MNGLLSNSHVIQAQSGTYLVHLSGDQFYIGRNVIAWEVTASAKAYPITSDGKPVNHIGTWHDGIMEREGSCAEYDRIGLGLYQAGTLEHMRALRNVGLVRDEAVIPKTSLTEKWFGVDPPW